MIRLLALAALLGGCAVDLPSGRVHIVAAEPLEAYVIGVAAWGALGYLPTFEGSDLPECEDVRDALAGEACELTIEVVREDNLVENYGAHGIASAERRKVWLDTRLEGNELRALAAHEFGHILIDSVGHAPTRFAVMGIPATLWNAQPADLALACETVGWCP